LNYRCAGYRRFFSYVRPYLDAVERTVEKDQPMERVVEVVGILDEPDRTA